MIFVNRSVEDEPDILNKVLRNNETETDRAIALCDAESGRLTIRRSARQVLCL